jgi:GAF domain-containing protein
MLSEAEQRGLLQRQLSTLERLLELTAADLRTTLNQTAQYVHEVLKADKVDAFLFDPVKNLLRACGTSDTPLGRLQLAQGLDVLPVANGGSVVGVFTTGEPHFTGQADQVKDEVPGLIHVLGVRSHIAVPIEVAGERRGVLSAQS